MAKSKQFSIVLPTYSGQRTIDRTFESLLSQPNAGLKYEVIVVIDGPSSSLKEKTDRYKKLFEERRIDFRVEQFSSNKGRFEARVAGAKKARHEQLLFLEDRVYLMSGYFQKLAKSNSELMLSNVLEDKASTNFIADTLTVIRRVVYGKRWGQDFVDYDIDVSNFENAPKGMASLWINKKLFLKICAEFKGAQKDTRDVNDDTGVLRLVVEKGNKIRRVSQLKVFYQPRTGLLESVKHLYQRGPKFVDYYLKPGTRFFYFLASFYVALAVVIVFVVLRPALLWFLFAGYLLAILILMMRAAQNFYDVLLIIFGLPVVALVFFSGVLKGTASILAGGGQ